MKLGISSSNLPRSRVRIDRSQPISQLERVGCPDNSERIRRSSFTPWKEVELRDTGPTPALALAEAHDRMP